MKTSVGGTVIYRGVTLLPCPEAAEVAGECARNGVLEIWSRGRRCETSELVRGDRILVANGACVEAGAVLAERHPWLRTLRAELPVGVEAIAEWSEPPRASVIDEITGLDVGPRFAPGRSEVRLVLRNQVGQVIRTHVLKRNTIPEVTTEATVRRGDRLASIVARNDDGPSGGIAELIAFLEARQSRDVRAVVAPCDGTVVALDARVATLRARDGRLLTLRLPGCRPRLVDVGDELCAGDAITSGERSHHALLHAWGEARLAAHMTDELEVEAARRGISVPRTYWALAVRAMLSWRRIVDPGDTGLRLNAIVSRAELARAQRRVLARQGRAATAVTALRGLRQSAIRSKQPAARV